MSVITNLNSVKLIGRVGKDPVIKQTKFGYNVSFSLATDKYKKQPDNSMTSETTWHLVNYSTPEPERFPVQKGSLVMVDGEIRYYTAKNRDTGADERSIAISAKSVAILVAPPKREAAQVAQQNTPNQAFPDAGWGKMQNQAPQQEVKKQVYNFFNDEIPF